MGAPWKETGRPAFGVLGRQRSDMHISDDITVEERGHFVCRATVGYGNIAGSIYEGTQSSTLHVVV